MVEQLVGTKVVVMEPLKVGMLGKQMVGRKVVTKVSTTAEKSDSWKADK